MLTQSEAARGAGPSSTARDPFFRNDLLHRMSASDRASLLPSLRRVKLVAGQVLFEAGEKVDRVYFLETGLVSLITPMRVGPDVENTSRGRDGAIGYQEACGSGLMLFRAVVQIGGEAFCGPADAVCRLHRESDHFRALLHRRMEVLLAESRQKSACRAVHPAWQRLIRTLLCCYDYTGERSFPLTQEYLAGMMGVGRTTVTHAAGRVQDLGLVRYSRGVVRLMDVEGLEEQVCECHGAMREFRRRLLDPITDERVGRAVRTPV